MKKLEIRNMETIAGGAMTECDKAYARLGAGILTGIVFGGIFGAAVGVFVGGIDILLCDK